MVGREDKKLNDLFYTCGLIAYIARKTKNTPKDVVNKLGIEAIDKIYDLADIYHSDNIKRVSDDFIDEYNITHGNFNNVDECEYMVPTHWDIGKVYRRLISAVAQDEGIDVIDALMKVYNSSTSDLIENYNSSFYYDNPMSIFYTYKNNGIPE